MIRLLSGLPGSGKSLRAVWYIRQWVAEGRHVVVCGLDGLNVDGVEVIEDPHTWRDLPDGSVVVVDECQKRGRFPTRGATGVVPESIGELSEHRHRGFDFLLISQHPAMIDSHVRRLVGDHEHLVRKFGLNAAQVFRWSEVNDTESKSARDASEESLWVYPKELFGLYKSATIHTVKRRIPKKLWAFVGAAALVPLLFWFAFSRAEGAAHVTIGDSKTSEPTEATAQPESGARVRTPEQWAQQWTPRIAGIPWSAPAYDGREVTTYPQLLCVVTGEPETGRCRCYTQQVTRVDAPDAVCRAAVLRGVFDPYADPTDRADGLPDTTQTSADRHLMTVTPPRVATTTVAATRPNSLRQLYRPPDSVPDYGIPSASR